MENQFQKTEVKLVHQNVMRGGLLKCLRKYKNFQKNYQGLNYTSKMNHNKPVYRKSSVSEKEYVQIHYWLRKNFGRAEICDNEDCPKKSKIFDWALKTGFKYEKKRENFRCLCRSCHVKYDWSEEANLERIKTMTGHYVSDETKRKMSLKKLGNLRSNTSGYIGVYFYKPTQKWMASIKENRKLTYLGYFPDKEDAARAYNEAARKLHGEFAYQNTL